MDQSFTLQQCLRLLYGELRPEEATMLKDIIRDVPRLDREYREMKRMKTFLDEFMMKAPEASVNNILQYSRHNSIQMSM